ncbi:Hypothetical predicted protein [Lecanosticta acicola]|uniref:Uncharacterized protein n=1 Tax=Lecanosticta acicola TaxID=111012 RepID=A0AAI8YTB7_9PEZI|nr:Hypothetical predicted protein [Lecanosticta acicola]
MDNRIMKRVQERVLLQAERDGRFCAQETEYHCITAPANGGIKTQYTVANDREEEKGFSSRFLPKISTAEGYDPFHRDLDWEKPYTLRCVLQRTRPRHVSTRPDVLPFGNAEEMRVVFDSLDLPASYFQIADGSPATARSAIIWNDHGKPERYELVAYCVTKQGDWGMALSHNASTMSTAAFWSVDERIDSQALTQDLHDFQDHAAHPMLIPCIMLSAALRMAVQRRHSIKERISQLESTISALRHPVLSVDVDEDPPDLDHLFELLQSCRKDQASRRGRYDFWDTFHTAIEEGFTYASSLAINRTARDDLYQWSSLTRQRLQSLKARDKDHTHRVDNISALLHNLVQQREIRLQSSIAKAARRDSQDMKFIAVLGSIFLPASLVATILNVPAFQFVTNGGVLFGAYVGITIPFVVVVVVLCVTRPYWVTWRVWGVRGIEQKGVESAGEKVDMTVPRRSSTLATLA